MHRILLIAKRDYVATIRTKAFLFGLIVAPLLFGGGFLGIALLKSRPDIRDRHVAVVDRTGKVAGAVIEAARERNEKELFDKATGRQEKPRYFFEIVPAGGDPTLQRLVLSDRVRRHDLFAFLEIGPEALHPAGDSPASKIAFYTNAAAMDNRQYWLADAFNEGIRRMRLAELGVDRGRFQDVLANIGLEKLDLVSRDPKTGRIGEARKKNDATEFGIPFGLMLLLGMIVMVGSAPMLSAVTEDKAQRIVEMLLGLATPFELMMGKVLGALGVSLTSSAFYIIGGTLALSGMGMAGAVPLALFPWFYIYLAADVMMLCAFAAALGAACSTPQDAQHLAIVLFAPVMIPYFVFMVVIEQPNSLFATIMSLFPPFTPMLMILRMALPSGIPAWQPWFSLLGVATFTLVTVWTAARIFRVAILMQGKSPNVADLVRWAVRG